MGDAPPLVGDAVNITEVFAQIAPVGFGLMFIAGVSAEFTTIIKLLLVAVVGLEHAALLLITQLTTSLLLRAELVYVGEMPFCTETPLILKLYIGDVPPLVGDAVNVTEVFEHNAPVGFGLILTTGNKIGFTVSDELSEVVTEHEFTKLQR